MVIFGFSVVVEFDLTLIFAARTSPSFSLIKLCTSQQVST